LGRWAKNITTPTPTGQGDGGLTASFRERAGLKATGVSDAMSTPRNLENVLQQKGQVYVTKEGGEGNSGRTSGGGEWADVVCHNVAIKTITIHVIEVVISITTIITYLHNYI
jgi:hypothetical protein